MVKELIILKVEARSPTTTKLQRDPGKIAVKLSRENKGELLILRKIWLPMILDRNSAV